MNERSTWLEGASGMQSLRAASVGMGVHPKRLRKMLVASGIVSEQSARFLSDGKILFDMKTARDFLARVSRSLSLIEAAEYLNVPRPLEQQLLTAGHIKPFILGGTETFKDHAIDSADLDVFLRDLLANAKPTGRDDGDLVSITTAARSVSLPCTEVVDLILHGKLERVRRNTGERGFQSIRVDPAEVRRCLIQTVRPGVSLREIERAIGSSTRVVRALVDNEYLPCRTITNPDTSMPQRIVEAPDLDAFLETFVSLSTLSKETGRHFRGLAAELGEAGIEPAFDPETVHATFYRRDEATIVLGRKNGPTGMR